MSDIFTPQLFNGIQPQQVAPIPQVNPAPIAPAQVAPVQVPKPIFIPVPMLAPKVEPKPKGLQISAEAVRKAQGIYPQEAQEKQAMVDNAKAPPAPTGAWGAPE